MISLQDSGSLHKTHLLINKKEYVVYSGRDIQHHMQDQIKIKIVKT